MNDDKVLQTQERVIEVLRTVFDPEIPVNIYDLGLIYRIELTDDATSLAVDMTLTAPNCPIADVVVDSVHEAVSDVPGVVDVSIELVFEPVWSQEMMTEEARLELGLM